MLKHYESNTNLEQLALLTNNQMNDLQYTWKYPGGLPKFLLRFCDLSMDLHGAGKPMEDTNLKSLFLSKIKDNKYKHIVDSYIDNPHQGFEECAQVFLVHYAER